MNFISAIFRSDPKSDLLANVTAHCPTCGFVVRQWQNIMFHGTAFMFCFSYICAEFFGPFGEATEYVKLVPKIAINLGLIEKYSGGAEAKFLQDIYFIMFIFLSAMLLLTVGVVVRIKRGLIPSAAIGENYSNAKSLKGAAILSTMFIAYFMVPSVVGIRDPLHPIGFARLPANVLICLFDCGAILMIIQGVFILSLARLAKIKIWSS